MRYIMYRFRGEPPKEPPAGMNDIVGMGRYQTEKNAYSYLWRRRLSAPKAADEITFSDTLKVMAQRGYTHFGIYAVPEDFKGADRFVRKIENPWGFLAPKIGQREVCHTCGQEIEYHGGDAWLDRGGNTKCGPYESKVKKGVIVEPPPLSTHWPSWR